MKIFEILNSKIYWCELIRSGLESAKKLENNFASNISQYSGLKDLTSMDQRGLGLLTDIDENTFPRSMIKHDIFVSFHLQDPSRH